MDESTVEAVASVANSDASPGLDAKMDALWSSSDKTGIEQAPSAEGDGAVQEAGDDAPPAPAKAEAAPAAAKPTVEPGVAEIPAGDLDDDIDIAKLEASGAKVAKIDMERFRPMYQGYKMAQQISQFAPSVEAARTHYERANDMRAMYADYTSGTPEGAKQFLDFWQSHNPSAFSNLATTALEMAPQEVQSQVRDSVIASTVDSAYQSAIESGDAGDLYRAQSLDYALHGKYRTAEDVAKVPKPDPVDARLKTIEAKEAEWKQREQRQADATWKSYQDNVVEQAYGKLNTLIGDTLKPVADGYKSNPMLLEALHDKIRTQVVSMVQGDREWTRQFNLDFAAARRNQDAATAQSLVAMYAAKVGSLVKAAAKPLMGTAAQSVKAASDAKHVDLSKSQGKRDIVNGGRPSPVAAPSLPRGASLDTKIDSFWKTVDSQQPRR